MAFAARRSAGLPRVVRPGGSVVVAFPSPDHLREVVAAFGGIGMADEKPGRPNAELGSAFDVASVTDVDARPDLDGAALTGLLATTPRARHPDAATLDRARTTTMSATLAATIVRAVRR